MSEIKVKITSSCLWCEKEIPIKLARRGKLLCSTKCLKRINRVGGEYDIEDVLVKKGGK